MQSQISLLRNATLGLAVIGLSIAACSSSTVDGPATSGTDSGAAEAAAMDDGSTVADSGAMADTGSGTDSAQQTDTGGGGKAFGVTCAANSECTSNMCFMGGMGSYCSMHCTAATQATDCPNPPTSGMCNGMGYCKK
jgi:hypothetical protein